MAEPVKHASIDPPYLRILRKAAQIAGGEAQLASSWKIPPERLRSWLAGANILPVDFYMLALEIVEQGPRRA
jgi:hypothetical protein